MGAVFSRFLSDCSGSTAIEYALIGSVISIAIVLAATAIGTRLNDMIGAVTSHFD